MKGLLLKDWYVLIKQSRMFLLILVLYAVLSATGNKAFGALAAIFVAMLPITLMGIDEKNKWEHLALTMPYEKKDIVLSRYLLTAVMLSVFTVIYLFSKAVQQIPALHTGEFIDVQYITLILTIGFVYPSLCLPAMFRFGVEKGRLWFVGITAVLGGATGGFFVHFSQDTAKVINVLMAKPWLALLMSLLLFLLSAAVSIRLYETREF